MEWLNSDTDNGDSGDWLEGTKPLPSIYGTVVLRQARSPNFCFWVETGSICGLQLPDKVSNTVHSY